MHQHREVSVRLGPHRAQRLDRKRDGLVVLALGEAA